MNPGSPRNPVPEPGRPGAGSMLPLVEGARLPLAFIGLGLIAFTLGSTWLLVETWRGWPPFFHPRVVALVHLWLPGFLLSVCIGASYQLMPVVLGSALHARPRWLWSHLILHGSGVGSLVSGLVLGRYGLAAAGGLAIGVGVAGLLVVTLRTFSASARRDAVAWSFPLAAAWLFATVLAGLVLALNRRDPFVPLPAMSLLRAHAHLGLVGYFLTLLQGVTFQLLPMFTMAPVRRPQGVWLGLAGTQIGLLLLAPSLAWDWSNARWMAIALLVSGLCCSGVSLGATLRTRRTRLLDPGLTAFVAGTSCLILATLVGLWLARHELVDEHSLAGVSVYGLLLIAGGLGLPILGMGCKILPFLVWMKVYGPRVGREDVPLAKALGSLALERAWLVLHLAGMGTLALGLGMMWTAVAGIGGILLEMGAVCYLANATSVVRHLGKLGQPTNRRSERSFPRAGYSTQ